MAELFEKCFRVFLQGVTSYSQKIRKRGCLKLTQRSRNKSAKIENFPNKIQATSKIFAETFGGLENMPYLCISFKNRIAGWSSGSSLGS